MLYIQRNIADLYINGLDTGPYVGGSLNRISQLYLFTDLHFGN